MNESFSNRPRLVEIVAHAIGWGIVFGFPLFFMNRHGEVMEWTSYLRHFAVPLCFILVFYLNYLVLIPRYLFGERMKQYLLLNLLLIAGISLGLHLWQEFWATFLADEAPPTRRPGPPGWIFFVRDLFSMVLTVALSAAICMSRRWGQIESVRREAERSRAEAERTRAEAEKSRAEAELKNLRNQLNPHFLLNTLNNIYALIAFDSDKAQLAVQELSRLLRHVLYDNQQTYVSLGKEMDFIRNYIELMRIRLTPNITVETDIRIDPDSQTQIAPLIFISLIENAFKHGISPTEPSFIRIAFSETEQVVNGEITNSYHPKNDTDKSGSGIGLEQVSKRLELLYPGRYLWLRGVGKEGKTYSSTLVIHHQSL